MKLLIITQKVDIDDPILGFFHRWIDEFSKYYESITVICLYKGKYNLPANVKVLSLGKENGESKIKYIFNFYKYIIQEKDNYDKVFVHMNPIYVVLGGVIWRIFGKSIALWYTHKNVDLKLRIAEIISNRIFSASSESFRLKSKKLHVVGHGIDIDYFRQDNNDNLNFNIKNNDNILRILHVGRITPIKSYEVLLKSIVILRDKYGIDTQVTFIGTTTNKKDNDYFILIKEYINKNNLDDKVNFVGAVNHNEIKKYYLNSDILVNMCTTGGLDKVVLESISLGIPAFFSNKAFLDLLGNVKEYFFYEYNNPELLASKINNYLLIADKKIIINSMVNISKTFDIYILIKKINNLF